MNFRELLKQHRVPTAPPSHQHAREGWIQFDCPFCGRNSQRWHMGYNVRGGYANCWKCGGHSMISVLMELLSLPAHQAKRLLGGMKIERYRPEKKPRGRLIIPDDVEPLCALHKEYLRRRNYDPDEIEKLWGIESIRQSTRLSWRIFIPIKYHGETVSWTTRSIRPHDPLPYINAGPEEEAMPLNSILYGLDYVRHRAVVLEGVTDVWRIGPGAVATFSTNYTTAQIKLLAQIPSRTIIFDNEKEAQKRARKLSESLCVFPGETTQACLDAGDPGSAGGREIAEVRRLFLK